MIFRGPLGEFLSAGIGLGVVGSAIVGMVIALGSSFPGMLAGVQDASAAVLGEISLYRDEPCTGTVVADTDCDVLHLSPERFHELCRRDTPVAAELHRFVARTLAGRVSHANESIRALQD